MLMDKKIKNLEEKTVARDSLKTNILHKDAEEDIHMFLATHDRGDRRSPIRTQISSKHSSNQKFKLTDRKALNESRGITNFTDKKLIRKAADDKDRGDLARKQVKVAIVNKTEESKDKVVIQAKIVKKATEKEESGQKPAKEVVSAKKIDDGAKLKILPLIKSPKFDKVEVPNRTYLDLEVRKRIREKYTVKLKSNPNYNKSSTTDKLEINKITVKNDDDKPKHIDEETENFKSTSSVKDCTPKPAKKKEPISINRKPIIKTITRNDNRIYKAVTFVEQKKTPAPLQIKIPHDQKPTGSQLKSTSKVSVQVKTKKKEKKMKYRPGSPVMPVDNGSPPTEVAKWAPSSITRQTKPYYEAWVDTTLAAINKCTKNEKMFMEKQDILRTFKRVLNERPVTPDLVYEKINDERYTGRIVIRRS